MTYHNCPVAARLGDLRSKWVRQVEKTVVAQVGTPCVENDESDEPSGHALAGEREMNGTNVTRREGGRADWEPHDTDGLRLVSLSFQCRLCN